MSRPRNRPHRLSGLLRCSLYAALALPLLTRPAEAPPPATPADAPSPPVAPSAEIDLEAVVVKQRRERQETVTEKIRKAMAPKGREAADLNRASRGMQNMAAWLGDADAHRHSPGDRSRDALAPPGDETDGCGADLSLGCEPQR